MTERLRVAHHFPPAVDATFAAIPGIGDVRSIGIVDRWRLPTDVDIIVPLHGATDPSADDAPRPPGWPGQVRFVQLASAGIDGYPRWLFDGPVVATAAGTTAQPIAEFALTAMLMHEKRLPAMRLAEHDAWTPQSALLARPLGSLEGRTLGLLGAGQIAQALARLAVALGMTVIATRRSDKPSPDPAMTLVALDELLARADHLVIAAPISAETAGLIGARALARVKPGVHLVNVARGGIVDTAALVEALASGRVGAATLDVTDPEPLPPGHPLWHAPNVSITPHIAWSSARTPQRIMALFAENLGRFAAGLEPVNRVERW